VQPSLCLELKDRTLNYDGTLRTIGFIRVGSLIQTETLCETLTLQVQRFPTESPGQIICHHRINTIGFQMIRIILRPVCVVVKTRPHLRDRSCNCAYD
jgi:hypothetical protein